jgi:hypothetical protein
MNPDPVHFMSGDPDEDRKIQDEAVLRIRDKHPGSRIRICIKEFKYFQSKKLFLL